MATSFEYSTQAATYDSTRAASPSVLGPIAEALGNPGGDAVLLDVGGGTGNYAVAMANLGSGVCLDGTRPVVLEVADATLRRL